MTIFKNKNLENENKIEKFQKIKQNNYQLFVSCQSLKHGTTHKGTLEHAQP